MKISWMTKNGVGEVLEALVCRGRHLVWIFLLLHVQSFAAETPKQLQSVIDDFLNMENKSIRIEQVIKWRFAPNDDSLYLNIDIKAGRSFHVTLPAFGMEIFVSDAEMMTLNHARQQLILENASPDALLNQLFVGGDLRDARFRKEKTLKNGTHELDFVFSGDFSDWDKMTIRLDRERMLQGMTLVDYDGNKYLIRFEYKLAYEPFVVPDMETDFQSYQIADLRENK